MMEQISSAAAQVIIALIPLVGIVMGAVVVFFYLFWNYRRRVLLIQAGQYHQPSSFDLHAYSLLAGLLLASVGVALTVFLAIVTGPTYGLLGGIIPLAMGVGLLVFYGITRRQG
jgi:hypothetical protein